MNAIRTLAAVVATTAAMGLASTVDAQSPPAAPSQTPKTIGRPEAPRVVPSMIVLNARGAKIQDKKLILEGISPNAIVFADRPVRSAGHALTAHLLEEWSSNSPDSFAKTAPNASVSVFSKTRKGVVDAVVVLKSPKLEGDRLTFDVDVLEGDISAGDGAASVFTDVINLPMPRRLSHRGAWYHGSGAN